MAMTAKAWNGRVILAWLSETLCIASHDENALNVDPRFQLIAGALSRGKT